MLNIAILGLGEGRSTMSASLVALRRITLLFLILMSESVQ